MNEDLINSLIEDLLKNSGSTDSSAKQQVKETSSDMYSETANSQPRNAMGMEEKNTELIWVFVILAVVIAFVVIVAIKNKEDSYTMEEAVDTVVAEEIVEEIEEEKAPLRAEKISNENGFTYTYDGWKYYSYECRLYATSLSSGSEKELSDCFAVYSAWKIGDYLMLDNAYCHEVVRINLATQQMEQLGSGGYVEVSGENIYIEGVTVYSDYQSDWKLQLTLEQFVSYSISEIASLRYEYQREPLEVYDEEWIGD